MISITKILLELQPGYIAHPYDKNITAHMDSPEGKRLLALHAWDKAPPGTPHPDSVKSVAPVTASGTPIASGPEAVKADLAAGKTATLKTIKKTTTPTEYQQNLTKTFNSLPNKGRDLRIAGTGQTGPVNPEHQKMFDEKFKQVAASNQPAGVPSVVKKAVDPSTEMTGTEHAVAAVKKGAEAVKNAGVNTVKKVGELAGEHPLAAGVVAGATGALGLRRLLKK